jgi:PAS domain S-box-containing protein
MKGMFSNITLQRKNVEELELYRNQLEEMVEKRTKELEKANLALKLSEEKFRDLYDNSPDYEMSLDPKTAKILECNNTLAKATGYTKEELIGKHIFEMYHPECHDAAHKAFQTFLKKGEIHNVELSVASKDGRKIPVLLDVTMLADKRCNIIYSRSVWHDITEIKQAEELLQRAKEQLEERTKELEVSEEKYRTLYNKSPGMMISVDVSNRKVVECNETLLEATGFSREEIIGKEVFDLYHPDSVETAHKVFNKFLATNEVHNADLQLIKKTEKRLTFCSMSLPGSTKRQARNTPCQSGVTSLNENV